MLFVIIMMLFVFIIVGGYMMYFSLYVVMYVFILGLGDGSFIVLNVFF